MISRISGEVAFQGLQILPQAILPSSLAQKSRALPIPGWSGHILGLHHSDRGAFEVEVLSDADTRIQVLLLAHSHPFYERNTPGDTERRAFHEGLISSELAGQREFSWGEVLCRLDARANKDWLIIAYNQGPHITKEAPELLLHLLAHQPYPEAA
jgi:hypothetical protein